MKHKKDHPANVEPAAPPSLQSAKPLIFVSHDSRDGDLAELFSNLLSDASGGLLKSFRSSDRKGMTGIEFGAEWYTTIMSRIGEATDVVALLTKHSVNRPWILYEAGVAKGKLNSTVFGVALGVPLEIASTGPFAQFQNCGDDEDSLTKLLLQLARRHPDASPREEAVRRQVSAFRELVSKSLATPTETTNARKLSDEASVAKLFEEVKLMFNELPERVDALMQRSGLTRDLSIHLESTLQIASGLLFRSETASQRAVAWLAFIGAFQRQMPWLYHPGLDYYRALMKGDEVEILQAKQQLLELLLQVRRSKAFDLMTRVPLTSEETRVTRQALEILIRYLGAIDSERGKGEGGG